MAEIGAGVAALILAAGQSLRLGRPKQLVLSDGETLLHRTVRFALQIGCSPVVVVLGAEERACRATLADLEETGQLLIVSNPDWQDGMSTTLRAGLSAIGDEAPVLMLVTDQVQLTADSLRRLLDRHGEAQAPVTAARYSGRLGVPAIFSPALLPKLASITGDKGARKLLEAWTDRAAFVEMPEAAADLDTREDLQAFGLSQPR